MSRNGNGTYNLPAGNPVVTGTTISSTWANNTLADMANAITGSIAADGQTPITGALKGTNGTVAFAGVGQTKIPSGTTAQRAASPTDGMIRYNTDLKQYEGYKDSAWSIFGNGAGGTLFSDTVTATQGQTVIVLTTGYVLGGDNLSVYVNGSRQIYNVNYTETSTTSFTFTTGLNAGDLVNYTIGASTSLSVNAASVLYNEGSTGAVDTNVKAKLQESVSVNDFGFTGATNEDIYPSLLLAYNSGAAKVTMPAGTFTLSQTFSILREFQLEGAGSSGIDFGAGLATTELVYTGTDVALKLGSPTATVAQNINVSNFMITGNSSALGGIDFGISYSTPTGEWFNESSATNLCVRNFTKTGAYGYRFKNIISSYFSNIISRNCYYGMASLTGDTCTSIRFFGGHNYYSTKYGTYLAGAMIGCNFSNLLNEQSAEEGLYIDNANTVGVDFYSYYSEGNGRTGSTWLAPITVKTSDSINFFGGLMVDYKAPTTGIYLDSASKVTFSQLYTVYNDAGFIVCTANTNGCSFVNNSDGLPSYTANNVTNNAAGRVAVNGNTIPFTVSAPTSGTPVTLVDFNNLNPTVGAYNFAAWVTNAGTAYLATATFFWDGTNLNISTNYVHGSNITLTVSTLKVQATQSSGGSATISYSYSNI